MASGKNREDGVEDMYNKTEIGRLRQQDTSGA